MQKDDFFRKKLRDEFESRSARNRRFSMRAFARVLGVDAGTTSRILAGKQVPGVKMARRICERLNLSDEEKETFLTSLAFVKKSARPKRMNPDLRGLLKLGRIDRVKELDLETYSAISEWYHSVILELPYTAGFDSDPRWIAARLGISLNDAKTAVRRLVTLGLMGYRDGKLVNLAGQLTTANKALTTAAHRKNQRQFLERAIHSLDNDDMEKRKMMRITMAIDPEKIPLAKEMIYRFSRRLCRILESGNRAEVYTFSTALFPNVKAVK